MYTLNDKIRDLEPYEPIAGTYNIRLDANESFLPLPEHLQQAMLSAVSAVSLNRYPDHAATELCKAVGEQYGVSPENVVVGNGSDELISVIFQSFLLKGETYATLQPDFSMYDFYGYVSECRGIAIEKDENWQISVDQVIETCNRENVKLLIFSNPCNPTGQGLSKEEVHRLVSGVSALVVLDEAYMDFWESSQSLLHEFADHDNLLILKTCSKAFGMAALRVGFAVGSEKLVRAIRAVKSPYNVNSISQAVAQVVLSDPEACKEATRKIVVAKNFMQSACALLLKPYPALELLPTVTNFVVIRSPLAEEIYRYMLERSIAVRYFKKMSALRITVGDPEETMSALECLQAYLEEKYK